MQRIFRFISLLAVLSLLIVPASEALADDPPPPPPPPPPLVLDAFDFIYLTASLAPNVDFVPPSANLIGKRGWRFSITNHSSTTVTNPKVVVSSTLSPSLFPNLTGGWPMEASQPSLGPEQTFNVHTLEQSNVGVTFQPGFAASRTVSPLHVPPGGGPQTVTVKVTPRAPRYNFPNAHISVTVFGSVLSATNPDISNGETLDISPSPPSPGATWMLHRVILNKEYVFTAVLQVPNSDVVPVLTKPEVSVEMTAHDSNLTPGTTPSTWAVIADPPLQGNISYSVNEVDRTWHRIADDYFVVTFPSVRGPVRVKTDIKPGSDPNSINLGKNGVVPVAILTITPQQADNQFGVLDAALLRPLDIRMVDAADFVRGMFPDGAAPIRSAIEDVDGDGDLDLLLIFRAENLVTHGLFDANTTAARLYGPAVPGQPPVGIRGEDSVRIVPAN